MKEIKLGCFGIVLSHPESNPKAASIFSDLREQNDSDDLESEFNAGVDAIEMLILAHFCAGVDVTTPAYLEGIETAHNSLVNNFL